VNAGEAEWTPLSAFQIGFLMQWYARSGVADTDLLGCPVRDFWMMAGSQT